MMRALMVVLMLMTGISVAYADNGNVSTTTQESTNVNSASSDSALSASDLAQAKLFGLSASQWARYKQLMNGPVKYIAPHLDPISVLGNYARNDKERRQLAELAVRQEYAYNEHMLAWVRAVSDTWRQMYPDVPLIDGSMAKMRLYGTPASSKVARLEYYTRIHRCDACNAETARVLAYASHTTLPLDIYITDADGDDNAIRKWAASMHIDPAKVFEHNITLNHDSGRLTNIVGLSESNVPTFVRNEGDGTRFTAIDVANHSN